MNDTPTPDIPDPASPTPATPEPARPRRVITRPDTMVGARLPGTVVTRPDSAQGSRLPGTYAANYGGDPNWKRGVTMLWLLFGLAAVAEFFQALFIILSGQRGYPGPGELARLGAEVVVFFLLWVGWSWVRWVLVAVDFLFGAWFIMRTIAPLPTDLMAAHPELRVSAGIATIPQLALGMIYLVSAGYLAFSADVISFVRHRREEGRGWVAVPIALVTGAFVALVCSVEPVSLRVFEKWRPEAGQFAAESLQAMADHWDVKAYDQRADTDYLKTWHKQEREQTFGTLAGLGTMQGKPEPKTTLIRPALASNGGSFLVRYHCDFGRVKFAHGDIVLGYIVSRHMLGPWRLENLEALDMHSNPEPAAAVPGAVPAEPTPPVPPAP